ncbi:MAG: DegV family protein [Lachnospiraceae bacterium]|nr:DegV family protein [Lachnospiraceae bacterium]
MKKIAIVTDSNSGITQEAGGQLGISVLPMPFTIDGETYFEGINLSQPEFYEKLLKDASISTSQPSPESVMGLWDKLLKDADEVVHIPMSSGLSGSCQTAIMLAEEYDGRVQVVNNQRISVTQHQAVLDALTLKDKGYSAAEIRAELERVKMESSIYIMVDTLKYLKKGGRITPAVATLGTLLRLKPVLQIQGERLDTFSKARTVAQARSIMIAAIKSDIEKRFGGLDGQRVWLEIAHTQNDEQAESFREELLAALPGYTEAVIEPLSLSVACHIGPGSLAVACSKKLEA